MKKIYPISTSISYETYNKKYLDKKTDIFHADCCQQHICGGKPHIIYRSDKSIVPDTIVIFVNNKISIIPDQFRMLYDLKMYDICDYKYIILVTEEEDILKMLTSPFQNQIIWPYKLLTIWMRVIINNILPKIAEQYNLSMLIQEEVIKYVYKSYR